MEQRHRLLWLCFALVSLIRSDALGRSGDFKGSTIVSLPGCCMPELVYRKFPPEVAIPPGGAWQLGFGAALDAAPPSVSVTLALDPASPRTDVQLTRGTAVFTEEQGLHHNYDPAGRFELLYTGSDDPFVGPVDFLLEPEGFSPIPVRVHLNTIEQGGFPIADLPTFSGTSPTGDVLGDGNRVIFSSGKIGGVSGVHAFDPTGASLSGWPFRLEDPEVTGQSYGTPAVVDLDGDGASEVLLLGNIHTTTGIVRILSAVDGAGRPLWQIQDEFEFVAIPAIADLDGDGELDIVVGARDNLVRLSADGDLLEGWNVEALEEIHVTVPVIADVDQNPGNGLEIVACTPIFGSPVTYKLYAWHEDGSKLGPAWPKQVERCPLPTVLDLDLDLTNGLEIVLAFDHATPPVDPDTGLENTFSVLAFHVDGSEVSGWPFHFFRDPDIGLVDDRIFSSVAAGDVDGDGDRELVIGAYGQGLPENGNLFLLHHDGTLDTGWPRWAGLAHSASEWAGPSLSDLDGDGLLEIVTLSFHGVYAFRSDGSTFPGFPKWTQENFAQPMIGDFDQDGRLEITSASLTDLHVWKILIPADDPAPWTRFRQNPSRTGTLTGSGGAVPSDEGDGGNPLTIAKHPTGRIGLEWGDSCQLGPIDYEIYEGDLGEFTTHVPVACSTGGATGALVTPSEGSRYYLVVPRSDFTEGSYGASSAGLERSASADACLALATQLCDP